jgi:hypothetical protein
MNYGLRLFTEVPRRGVLGSSQSPAPCGGDDPRVLRRCVKIASALRRLQEALVSFWHNGRERTRVHYMRGAVLPFRIGHPPRRRGPASLHTHYDESRMNPWGDESFKQHPSLSAVSFCCKRRAPRWCARSGSALSHQLPFSHTTGAR